jgi:hypothetical protein
MLMKTGLSRQIPKGERRSESRQAKGERGIRRRRYWEQRIRDDRDFARHPHCIRYDLVQAWVCGTGGGFGLIRHFIAKWRAVHIDMNARD